MGMLDPANKNGVLVGIVVRAAVDLARCLVENNEIEAQQPHREHNAVDVCPDFGFGHLPLHLVDVRHLFRANSLTVPVVQPGCGRKALLEHFPKGMPLVNSIFLLRTMVPFKV